MNVVKITPRGYCLGVVKAIKMANDTIKKYPNKKIYMLGRLVHNSHINNYFEEKNVIIIDDFMKDRAKLIKNIEPNQVVILSAHGSSKEVIEACNRKKLIIVNTQCEWVTRTQLLIEEKIKDGYDVIFIGVENHPETIALTYGSNKIHLITREEDLNKLKIKNKNIFATNQTTLSILQTQNIYDLLKIKYPEIIFKNDICLAAEQRQQAILNLDNKNIDLLIVVGDQRSNNSKKLLEMGQQKNIPSIMISSVDQLDLNLIKNIKTVAVTAGTSTPSIVQNNVIKFLEKFN